jgi:hypothetical protein
MNNFTFILSYEEMTKIKIVYLDELHNFIVQNLFIWINSLLQNMTKNCFLLSVFCLVLDKDLLCQVLKKTLGKSLDTRSTKISFSVMS